MVHLALWSNNLQANERLALAYRCLQLSQQQAFNCCRTDLTRALENLNFQMRSQLQQLLPILWELTHGMCLK